ncbi:hypothetical protein ACQEU6_13335 [Spirillospora sp. CA-108201]
MRVLRWRFPAWDVKYMPGNTWTFSRAKIRRTSNDGARAVWREIKALDAMFRDGVIRPTDDYSSARGTQNT